jgi:hypothetical protein
MSNANGLAALRTRLSPAGQQRLFEFFDAIDTDTAARFRDWLGTASDPELTAVVDLLNRASHGREFAGWWHHQDKFSAPHSARSVAEPYQPATVKGLHSRGQPRRSDRDLTVGGAWLIGGALVTIISYTMAANNPGGGRYIIATGAIVYGGYRLFRGLAGR